MSTQTRSGEIGRLDERARELPPTGTLSRPLEMSTAVDEVADRLLTAIALGEFVPGERLPVERALVSMLGVSRSTVHAAVGRLRSAGVVEVRRGRAGGAFVRNDWSGRSADAVARTLGARWSHLEELFDLRGLVEGMVARTAAERRTEHDIEALQRALERFARAVTPQDEHAADTAIHDAVTAATGNKEVAVLSRRLLAAITAGIPIEPYSRDVFDRALAEHQALVEAVVEGDVERAGRVAESHFAMTQRTMRGVLQRGMTTEEPPDRRLGHLRPT
jgi:GntR family transcriptional regulator, transcriptional repressor for pyruvate dehydrogenase complex